MSVKRRGFVRSYLVVLCLLLFGAHGGAASKASEADNRDLVEGRLFVLGCAPGQEQDGEFCVERDEGILGTGLARETRAQPPEIFVARADGRVRQLTHNALVEFGPTAWSPDGKRFAISADEYGDWEECRLYVVDVRDGAMEPITPPADLACPSAMDWSPDGRWILMTVYFHDGPTQIYKVRPDGSDLTCLTDFFMEGQDVYRARWIDGGKRIVFEGHFSKKTGMYVMAADGSNWRALMEMRWRSRPRHWLTGMAVSPDRRRVAYILYDGRKETHRPDEVFTLRTDGSEHRRLTFNRTDETALSWAPDSQRLAIVEGSPYESQPRTRIKILDIGSASSSSIKSPGGHIYRWSGPAWSPSGRHLAFIVSRVDGFELYTASRHGSRVRRVTWFERVIDVLHWRK